MCGGLLCLLIIIVAVHADMILLNNSHLLTTLLLSALSAGKNRCARYMPLPLLNLKVVVSIVLTHLKNNTTFRSVSTPSLGGIFVGGSLITTPFFFGLPLLVWQDSGMKRILGTNYSKQHHTIADNDYVDIAASRFRREIIRRTLCALSAVVLMCCLLFTIATRTQSNSVVIAARDIVQGRALTAEDVTVTNIAASTVSRHIIAKADKAIGLVARTPITQGEPLLASSLTKTPQVPNGHTTVSIQPASMPADISVGDTAQILSTQCPAESILNQQTTDASTDTTANNDTSEANNEQTQQESQANQTQNSCTVSDHALISAIRHTKAKDNAVEDSASSPLSLFDTESRHYSLSVDVALPASQALALVRAQEQGSAFIIAASR